MTQKKTTPSVGQLKRLDELIDHPAVTPWLDLLLENMGKTLKTYTQAKATLNLIDHWVADYENARVPLNLPNKLRHGTLTAVRFGCRCVPCRQTMGSS